MAALDRLAPDQRAALMLILQQGQSYDDLAQLLASDPSAIRARAHAAIEVVGGDKAGDLDPAERGEINDYMLGQQSYSRREETRGLLNESPPARAWARTISEELRPLMPDEPPGVPDAPAQVDVAPKTQLPADDDPPSAIRTPAGDPGASRSGLGTSTAGRSDATAAREPGPPTSVVGPRAPASTRRGGIVLIVVGAAALAVAIILLANSGGSSTNSTTSTASTPAGTGSTATTPRVQVIANVPLGAADGSSARGAAEVVQQPGTATRAFLIAGTGLSPSSARNAYAVWLYNSPRDALSLGFFAQAVGSKGQLEGTAAVPADVNRYTQIIVTRETTSRPARPGTIVLRGALKLPAG